MEEDDEQQTEEAHEDGVRVPLKHVSEGTGWRSGLAHGGLDGLWRCFGHHLTEGVGNGNFT